MKQHPDSSTDWDAPPAKSIGLGERSFPKSYAPEVERRLVDLERFRALLDQGNDLIFLAKIPSGRFADVNDSACRQLGYSREALLAMSLANLVPEPIWEEMAAFFADEGQVDQGGIIIATSFRGESGDMSVEMSVRLVTFGDAVYAVIVARDITGRQRAEEGLQESETRFRSVIESSPMGMHIYHLESDGRLVFVGANPAADRILGVDNSQFIGKTIEEAFPPLAATEVPERYRRAAARGESWVTEQIDYQDEGIAGAFEVHAFQTGPGRMVTMFLDITERKQAEVELRQLKEFNESIVQNVAEGITVQDAEGCFTFVNPAAANLLGYTVEKLTGQHWTSIIPLDQQPIVRAADQRRMQGKTDRYELELVGQD
ncbi:MAG: PAS domain S-box protein, partial [Anaerolineae bacterium]